MATIFTRIINGEIPAYQIAEDENFIAILDINPLVKGHALVIPKQEVDYIFDLEDSTYLGLFFFAKKVGAAIEKTVPCERIGMAVIGLEVPHVHVHLVPLNNMGDINFTKSRVQLSKEEFEQLAQDIRANFQQA
ncbi:MAG: HIT family protein [Chitinophagales bacterium]|nr:HIT family protein [Chitinophagales bacterium]